VVRCSLAVRILSIGWMVLWVGFLVSERSAQGVAGIAMAVLIIVGAWRGLLVLRGGTIA